MAPNARDVEGQPLVDGPNHTYQALPSEDSIAGPRVSRAAGLVAFGLLVFCIVLGLATSNPDTSFTSFKAITTIQAMPNTPTHVAAKGSRNVAPPASRVPVASGTQQHTRYQSDLVRGDVEQYQQSTGIQTTDAVAQSQFAKSQTSMTQVVSGWYAILAAAVAAVSVIGFQYFKGQQKTQSVAMMSVSGETSSVKYFSTRGSTEPMSFKDAVIVGQAPDNGLLLPETIPDVSDKLESWRGLGYKELALEVMSLYASGIPREDLKEIIDKSYSTFDVDSCTPVVNCGKLDILELWHGPTLAFKDVALQFLSNCFEYILAERGEVLNILGATSGDTGSAAIHGIKGKDRLRVFIMHPEGKTSRLQALQMISNLEDNVYNIAINGTFDDCQAIMKNTFSDAGFKEEFKMGTINSINFARILAQIVYYFSAYFQVTEKNDEVVNFSVPTGNFGDIFAGFLAKKMGLPVGKLVLATNENAILAKFFQTGEYKKGEVQFTISPSMDIQVASNFERYIYYRSGGDSKKVVQLMKDFGETGCIKVEGSDPNFEALQCTAEATLATIAKYAQEHDYVLDPHTATGVWAAEQLDLPGKTVCLATAHPAKFPAAIKDAIDETVTHPSLEVLNGKPNRYVKMALDTDSVKSYVSSQINGTPFDDCVKVENDNLENAPM